jgi:hypothetical protein
MCAAERVQPREPGPADPGWHLHTFTAAPGSSSGDRLCLLASWAVAPAIRRGQAIITRAVDTPEDGRRPGS